MATDIENISALNLEENGIDDDIVDPWNVIGKSDGGIDYDKLISRYYFRLIQHTMYNNPLHIIIITNFNFVSIW